MRILIAPQAFKGGLTGIEAAQAVAQGVQRQEPDAELVLLPIADGGDGTLEALLGASNLAKHGFGGSGLASGKVFRATVTGPTGDSVEAVWGVMQNGSTAVIEMARASGLSLVQPEQLNPRLTTSYGTGQLIRTALSEGYQDIIVGLGGSATNDGGVGIAQALGARFLDQNGSTLPFGGAALAKLAHVDLTDLDPRLRECHIRAATDVDNPLCGPEGASVTYGPQKGATPEMITELDAALENYADVINQDLGINVLSLPRAGAAGGAGATLYALLGSQVDSGAGIVCEALRIEERLQGIDLVITGEGRMDWQTIYDKAPIAIAHRARNLGIPVLAVAGSLGPGYERVFEHGIILAEPASLPGISLDQSMARAAELVANAAERAIKRALLVYPT